MKSFLQQIAQEIHSKYADKTQDICIVLPNRRAIRFLQEEIAKEFKQNTWLPQMYSLSDFIYKHSDYMPADKNLLLFELYSVHRAITNKEDQKEDFEHFLSWGPQMITDFNEIDMQLVDAQEIFHFLSDTKAMSLWTPEGEELTEFQRSYLEFYRSLYIYYSRLNEKLHEKKLAYQGMAYKDFSQKINAEQLELPYHKILFCGFNALTKSEKTSIDALIKQDKAEIFFDADPYYLDNKMHEAGLFMRELKQEFKINELHWEKEHFKQNKNINIVGVAQSVGQAKYAGEILQQYINKKEELDKTIVVMNDEQILEPLLNSIPPEIEDVNVSIGYSLSLTPIFQFAQDLLEIYRMQEKQKKNSIYHKHLTKLLHHPYSAILATDKEKIESILHHITIENKSFISISYLEDRCKQLQISDDLIHIFRFGIKAKHFLAQLIDLSTTLIDKAEIADKELLSPLEREAIIHFQNSLVSLSNFLDNYHLNFGMEALWKLMKNSMANKSIPFVGEPLKGLQLMGMLETRNLDFKNLIMLSINEGYLPASKTHNSFIPINIKREFGIPDFNRKDAIYAYHFYRLLQRAENIYLLYNTQANELGGGEKSRFIHQLEFELKEYNPNIQINYSFPELAINSKEDQWLTEAYAKLNAKDENIQTRLHKIFQKGISASALNTYMLCPRKFYYRYILRLDERDEITEQIDERNIGNIIHNALEELYKPYVNKRIDEKAILSCIESHEEATKDSFKKNNFNAENLHGKSLLMFHLAKAYIKNFLEAELKEISSGQNILINQLEDKNEEDIKDNYKLRGTIDRIDTYNNTIRIIDYKTGKYDASNDLKMPKEKPESIDELLGNRKYKKSIQLLVYILLYVKNKKLTSLNNIKTGMYFLQYPSKGLIDLQLPDYMQENSIAEIENFILMIIKHIENSKFERYPDEQYKCKYCPYQSICH